MSTSVKRRRLLGRFISPIWMVLIAVVIIAAFISDRFLSPYNMVTVLQQGVVTGIVALGMTVVLIGGQFDLSTGAIVMMAAVMALVIGPSDPASIALAIILPLMSGAFIGAVNGLVVYKARANSIVATIGMQFFLFGAVLAGVSGQHVRTDNMAAGFSGLANAKLFGIPLPVYLFVVLVVVLSVVMDRTVFGRHVYGIGGDEEASRRAGIRVVWTGTLTFVLSGMLAALSGIFIASLVGNVDPSAIGGYAFPALTAVVLGGTSLSGGMGRPSDTAAAILVIAVINNVMTILNYQYPIQLLVQGVVLAGAVAFYSLRRVELAP
ncbi:ABC transporter permease [Mesorhizobium retamae]|uniref:ABC transporter permease n=1 Tax=Mesorhizobium retamae TaxID=2912854 RepID=A0ABS9QD58_9HYPH|nr:ABC transporter permease [Mesorhizobium sp. IRAMC:0171]MCG7505354.1 ABC transporter permease [Mesorhizobium sp. IRAMC:0171]